MASRSPPPSTGSRTASPMPSAASFSSGRGDASLPTGSTLSKVSLYAPLTEYLRAASQAGSTNKSTSAADDTSKRSKSRSPTLYKRINPSISESALIDHLTAVSAAYHSSTSASTLLNSIGAGLGKNNGGQGLHRRAFEDRISQRSLVLVGGGLMTGVVGTAGIVADGQSGGDGEGAPRMLSKSAVEVSRVKRRKRKRERGHRVRGSISNRERKRRLKAVEQDRKVDTACTKGDEKDVGPASDNKATGTTSSSARKLDQQIRISTTETLLALNNLWNGYICKLLGLEQGNSDVTAHQMKSSTKGNRNILTPPRTPSEISSHLSSAELIGAYVKVMRCDGARSYVGKEGIVVDTTVNTWRIAFPSSPVEKTDTTSDGSGAAAEGEKKDDSSRSSAKGHVVPIWKERIVPKHRSELAFSIKLNDGVAGANAREEDMKRTWHIMIKGISS